MRTALKKKTSDLLHKGFDSVSCKIKLKLLIARLKILRNRSQEQAKVLKREIAQLLESGHEENARVKVEHVIREEKRSTAYELIELYCEVIVARLSIVESNKECPNDLKEAVASVIFAQPRCADLSELKDVRKHLTSKYGKDFADAAVELRPQSGVSSQIIEKLSVNSPDAEAKLKALTKIATEHGIDWKPKSLEEDEKKSSDGFLSGPTSFGSAVELSSESVKTNSVAHVVVKQEPAANPVKQQVPIKDGFLSGPATFESAAELASESVKTNSIAHVVVKQEPVVHPVKQQVPSKQENLPVGYSKTEFPTISTHEGRDAELNAQETKPIHVQTELPPSMSHQQYWSRSFKSASDAAEAAAKSAELASFAAIAAANFAAGQNVPIQQATVSLRKATSGSNLPEPHVQLPVQRDGRPENEYAGNSIGEGPLQGGGRSGLNRGSIKEYKDSNHRSGGSISRHASGIVDDMHNPDGVLRRVEGRFQEKNSAIPNEHYEENEVLSSSYHEVERKKSTRHQDSRKGDGRKQRSASTPVIVDDIHNPDDVHRRVEGRFREKSSAEHISDEYYEENEILVSNSYREVERKKSTRHQDSRAGDMQNPRNAGTPFENLATTRNNSHKEQTKYDKDKGQSSSNVSTSSAEVVLQHDIHLAANVNAKLGTSSGDFTNDYYYYLETPEDSVSEEVTENHLPRSESRGSSKVPRYDDQYQSDSQEHDSDSRNFFPEVAVQTSKDDEISRVGGEDAEGKRPSFSSSPDSSHFHLDEHIHSRPHSSFVVSPFVEEVLSPQSMKTGSYRGQAVPTFDDDGSGGEVIDLDRIETGSESGNSSPRLHSESPASRGKWFPETNDAAPQFDQYYDSDHNSDRKNNSLSPRGREDRRFYMDSVSGTGSSSKTEHESPRFVSPRYEDSREEKMQSPDLSSATPRRRRRWNDSSMGLVGQQTENDMKVPNHPNISSKETVYVEESFSSYNEDRESRNELNLQKNIRGGIRNRLAVAGSRRTRGTVAEPVGGKFNIKETSDQVQRSRDRSDIGSSVSSSILEKEIDSPPARNQNSFPSSEKIKGSSSESLRDKPRMPNISDRDPLLISNNRMGFASPNSSSDTKMKNGSDHRSWGRRSNPSRSSDESSGSEPELSKQGQPSRTIKERDSRLAKSVDTDMAVGPESPSSSERSRGKVISIRTRTEMVKTSKLELSGQEITEQRKNFRERADMVSGSYIPEREVDFEESELPARVSGPGVHSRKSEALFSRESAVDPSKQKIRDRKQKSREKSDREDRVSASEVGEMGQPQRRQVTSITGDVASRKVQGWTRGSIEDVQEDDIVEPRVLKVKPKPQTKVSYYAPLAESGSTTAPEDADLIPRKVPEKSPRHRISSPAVSVERETKGGSNSSSLAVDSSSTARTSRKPDQRRAAEQQRAATPPPDEKQKEPPSIPDPTPASSSDGKQGPKMPPASSEEKSENLPHVHPKLPKDYDAFMANLQWLRSNAAKR